MEGTSKYTFGLWEKGKLPLTEIITDSVKSVTLDVGAISFFLGIVRKKAQSGIVKHLTLEAYEEETTKVFHRIASTIKRKYLVSDVRIHHVIGELQPGDLIMMILVSGNSRKNVVEALKGTVEEVKSKAPLWKKETLMSGDSYWIEYHET